MRTAVHGELPDARVRDMTARGTHGIDVSVAGQGDERDTGDGRAVAVATEIADLEERAVRGDGQNGAIGDLVTGAEVQHAQLPQVWRDLHDKFVGE